MTFKHAAHRAAHFISSFWFEILPVIHLTMVKADLDHRALEKVPFYEVRLIHRKDIHMASVHSAVYSVLSGFFRYCPSYLFSNISLAVNNSLPQRPYMVRFIIFNLLFVPSTKPFDRGLATAFSTADKSFSSPDAKR